MVGIKLSVLEDFRYNFSVIKMTKDIEHLRGSNPAPVITSPALYQLSHHGTVSKL